VGAETGAAESELAELTVAEVRALLAITLPLPAHSLALHYAWSDWRRHKRHQSRHSYRRRAVLAAPNLDRPSPPGQNCYLRLYY
jgi:hypothetical protein